MTNRRPIREVRASFIEHAEAPAIDAAQVAELLGVTRRRVNAMALDEPTFPRAFTVIGGARLWYRPGIEIWAAGHRPARQGAHGIFGPEAGAVLRMAEAIAAAFRQTGIGEDHFWLALVDPAAPGVARDALASLGVDREEVLPALLRAWPPADVDGYPPAQRMSPYVQLQVSKAADHREELGAEKAGADAIALGLLDDWPKATRDRFARRGCAVTSWLAYRGLDANELRGRIVRGSRDPGLIASLEPRVLPKRRPPSRRPRRRNEPKLAPNPLGHDPRDRHPWGSIFATRIDGKAWIEDGRQYFFFYDRDRYRVMTAQGAPIGYWWDANPRLKPGQRPRGSRREVVLPQPGPDVRWPERLSMDPRSGLLARRHAG